MLAVCIWDSYLFNHTLVSISSYGGRPLLHQDSLVNEICNLFLPHSSAVLSLGKEGEVTVSASPKKIGISMESDNSSRAVTLLFT